MIASIDHIHLSHLYAHTDDSNGYISAYYFHFHLCIYLSIYSSLTLASCSMHSNRSVLKYLKPHEQQWYLSSKNTMTEVMKYIKLIVRSSDFNSIWFNLNYTISYPNGMPKNVSLNYMRETWMTRNNFFAQKQNRNTNFQLNSNGILKIISFYLCEMAIMGPKI